MSTVALAPVSFNTKAVVVALIGTLLVVIGLAFGALAGSLISPDTAAHATTPHLTSCKVLCDTASGAVGNVPAPITSAQGGVGNR